MSIDIRDIDDLGVTRLTGLLSRRPEYGIATPSRRWLCRQTDKIGTLPSELLRSSSLLKRLIIRLADKLDPTAVDPRAVLCQVHTPLNPWLIRRLFLAVAYEVTVYTDVLRSWKGRIDSPVLSTFVGRVDSIAALWTEPELYRECYGVPPFDSHTIFVSSSCEACILSAVGANARILADLRAILIDRIERRPPRRGNRPARKPRLLRYIEEWINHFGTERAAMCEDMSEEVLSELRAKRSQLAKWRVERRKEIGKRPVYTELKKSPSGHQFSNIPREARHQRRTRDGIPVAMADRDGAEDQRRAAMHNSMMKNGKSLYRPDSLNGYTSQAGGLAPGVNLDPIDEQEQDYYGAYDLDDDYEADGDPDLERDFEEEERSRIKVTDWYSERLSSAGTSRRSEATRSVLSTMHPAFQPAEPLEPLSPKSAAPTPLNLRRDRESATIRPATDSAWTDATVYTYAMGNQGSPPVPRVPSKYRQDGNKRNEGRRPTVIASSVYSDQPGYEPGPTRSGSVLHRSASAPARNAGTSSQRRPPSSRHNAAAHPTRDTWSHAPSLRPEDSISHAAWRHGR